MLQAICECGRIAEVRRRKNGKKLRYLHCVKCGTSLGSAETAKRIESAEKMDIGVKGEFPENSKVEDSNISENLESVSEPEMAANAATTPNEWKPEPEDMPEALEPTVVVPEKTEIKTGANSGGGSKTWKYVVGVCVTFAIGGGVYAACRGQ